MSPLKADGVHHVARSFHAFDDAAHIGRQLLQNGEVGPENAHRNRRIEGRSVLKGTQQNLGTRIFIELGAQFVIQDRCLSGVEFRHLREGFGLVGALLARLAGVNS